MRISGDRHKKEGFQSPLSRSRRDLAPRLPAAQCLGYFEIDEVRRVQEMAIQCSGELESGRSLFEDLKDS